METLQLIKNDFQKEENASKSLMSTSTTRVISIPKKEHCRLLSPQSQSTASSFTVSLAQTSTPIACLTAQKPWVIDSSATNHTIGTRGLLFDLRESN
jgi:hypothetical protein